jgi:hypothetical protein
MLSWLVETRELTPGLHRCQVKKLGRIFVHTFAGTHPLNPLLLKREGDFQILDSALPLLFSREGGRGMSLKTASHKTTSISS